MNVKRNAVAKQFGNANFRRVREMEAMRAEGPPPPPQLLESNQEQLLCSSQCLHTFLERLGFQKHIGRRESQDAV